MRISLLFLFFFFLSFIGGTQVVFQQVKHNFGELESYSSRYVDIVLENKSSKLIWVLRVKKPRDVIYIISEQKIEKDSSIVLRFQVNPKQVGRFSYTIEIYTSDKAEATKVKLTGNLIELDQSTTSFTDCPTFSDEPKGSNTTNFELTVVTIDKETKKELSHSKVVLIQNGQAVWEKETNKNGRVKEKSTLGLSYFYASHEGYSSAEMGAYINFKRNFVVLELEKDEVIFVDPPLLDSTVIVVHEEEIIEEIIIEIEEEIEETNVVILEETDTITRVVHDQPSFEDLSTDNFDEKYFKPINVVFVLDVSSSMRQIDKIELMKYALIQLAEMLRPQDQFGIVTYSTNTRILLEPTSGASFEKIKNEVSKLKAFGYTSGGEGIKLGYKIAYKSRIENGTNLVIVITDGAFNRNSDDYKKYIKKYKKKGILLSVVGIKNKAVDADKMEAVAQLGGGDFISIMQLIDAQNNLKQAIRKNTFKL